MARILLVLLFLVFGWSKFIDYAGTVAAMARYGAPLPPLAAAVAIVLEFFGAIAIVVGVITRPVAVLLAVYTVAAALIAHHYWTMTGGEQVANMINFYKNISIAGGFLLLYIAGPGRYSVDARLGRRLSRAH